jgi:hypothetical protein
VPQESPNSVSLSVACVNPSQITEHIIQTNEQTQKEWVRATTKMLKQIEGNCAGLVPTTVNG